MFYLSTLIRYISKLIMLVGSTFAWNIAFRHVLFMHVSISSYLYNRLLDFLRVTTLFDCCTSSAYV